MSAGRVEVDFRGKHTCRLRPKSCQPTTRARFTIRYVLLAHEPSRATATGETDDVRPFVNILSSVLRKFGAGLRAGLTAAWLRIRLRWAGRNHSAVSALMAHAVAAGDDEGARLACEILQKAGAPASDALARLADLYMQQRKPQLAHDLYVAHAAQVGSTLRPKLYRSAYMDPARAGRHEPYVHTLRDVVLETTQCAIFDDGNVYIRETSGTNFENSPHLKVRATPDQEFFVIACREPQQVIEQACVLLGTDGAHNYSHWLTRNLFKLALLEWSGVSTTLPLVVNEDLRGYQLEAIEMLEIPRSRLMLMRRDLVVRCREINVPVNMRGHPRMRASIEWLRGRLARFMEPVTRAETLLYVSRQDSRRHVLLNEPELTDALARLGFETVVLSGMSLADQIRRFSRARVIVGGHGAGLTNIIFAPPQASIVEITNANLRHMGDFRVICKAMGMRYTEIVSNRFAPEQVTAFPPDFDYYVDIKGVTEAVRSMLGNMPAVH